MGKRMLITRETQRDRNADGAESNPHRQHQWVAIMPTSSPEYFTYLTQRHRIPIQGMPFFTLQLQKPSKD